VDYKMLAMQVAVESNVDVAVEHEVKSSDTVKRETFAEAATSES
jgi:hypothetical protein